MKHLTRFFSLSMLLLFVALKASAQSSPMIITSPTQLDYSTTIGLPVEKVVNAKVAGLPSLALLSSFKAIVQGQNADQFSVEMPSLSLVNILEALLGQGINIKVTYNPTFMSLNHKAELLIETALLGVLLPVQTIVPINAEGFEPPLVESTSPADGAVNVPENTTSIRINYDGFISLKDRSKIKINGVPVTSCRVDQIVLIIDLPEGLNSNTLYTVTVEAGAIAGNAGYSTTVEDFSFSFRTVYIAPTYTITPAPGSIIYIDYPTDEFYVNIQFSAPVQIKSPTANYSEGYISFLRQNPSNPNVVTIASSSISMTGANQPYITLSIPAGAIADANDISLDAINVGTYQVFAGPYVTNVSPTPGTGENDAIITTTNNFRQTVTFTFNKNIRRVGNSNPVTLTDSQTGLSIQSYRIEGNKLIVVVSGTVRSYDYFTLNLQAGSVASYEDFIIPNLGGSYQYVVERRNASRGLIDTDSNNQHMLSAIVSESYYTIMGIQVSKDNLQRGQVYIRKTTYEDGTVDTRKFMYQVGK